MMQYLISTTYLLCLTLSTVSLFWCFVSNSHLNLLDCNILYFPDILIILEKHRNIACLFILHKILHNVTIRFIANSLNFQNQLVLLGIKLNKMITCINSHGVLTILLLISGIFYLTRQSQQYKIHSLALAKKLCDQ